MNSILRLRDEMRRSKFLVRLHLSVVRFNCVQSPDYPSQIFGALVKAPAVRGF